MHLIIAHAKPPSPAHLSALHASSLPHLQALLQTLNVAHSHNPNQNPKISEESLTPLSEVIAATALGLEPEDGLVPWAAMDARQQALPAPASDPACGWAWITPCHWQVNANHVAMGTAQDASMTSDEMSALFAAMRPYFEEDGIALHPLNATTWLAHGAVFHALPTASLQRVWGQAVDPWIPRQSQARTLRRLQNEMQMLLYTHPVNDARSARGQRPINGFWVSGTGDLPAGWQPQAGVVHSTSLSAPALLDDPHAWTDAWQVLDQGSIQQALSLLREGQHVQLTLCSETSAQTWAPAPMSLGQRVVRAVRQRLQPVTVQRILSAL